MACVAADFRPTPGERDNDVAGGEGRQQHKSRLGGAESAAVLKPLGEPVQEGIADGPGEHCPLRRRAAPHVAGLHAHVDERGPMRSSCTPKAVPTAAVTPSSHVVARPAFIRKSSSDDIAAANRIMPMPSKVSCSSPGPPSAGWRGKIESHHAGDRERDVDREGGPPTAESNQQSAECRPDDGNGLGGHRQRHQDACRAGDAGSLRLAADQVHRGGVAGARSEAKDDASHDEYPEVRCEHAEKPSHAGDRVPMS